MKKVLHYIGWFIAGLLIALVLLSLSLFLITRGEYSVPVTVAQDRSIPHIEIENTIFHVQTFGDTANQTVIVIHGGPGNDFRYLLPIKELAKKYFVVFYDQRGTGLSPRVDASEHSLENSLKDLGNIIDFYSPNSPVNLIGHSWGGMLAAGYIAQNPTRVVKAVIAEPGMLTTEKAKEYMQKFRIKPTWSVIKSMALIAFEGLHINKPNMQDRIDYIFSRISTLDVEGNPMRKYFCNEDISSGHTPYWRLSGVASQSIMQKGMDADGNIQIDLVSGLENYPNKVLFMVGECSQIIGEEFQQGHIKHFRNAEMVVIKGAGHTMLGEKPEECIAIIEKYFDEN